LQTLTFNHTYQQTGTYTIIFRVRNTNTGQEVQSSTTVQVTAGSSQTGNTSLYSVSPVQGQKGTLIVLYGNNFSATDNTVHFGVGGSRNVPSTNNGTTIYFTVPHYVSSCDLVVGYCGSPVVQVNAGSYPVYVQNSNGTSQTINFTVND